MSLVSEAYIYQYKKCLGSFKDLPGIACEPSSYLKFYMARLIGRFTTLRIMQGSGFSTVVERMPHVLEVVCWNPAFVSYISSSVFISSGFLPRSLEEKEHY